MQLNAKTTALVLIDLQQGVLAMPVAPHPAGEVYAGAASRRAPAQPRLPGRVGARVLLP